MNIFAAARLPKLQSFIAYCLEGDTIRRSIKTALVVGTILAVINHGQDMLAGHLSWHWVVPMLITYLVPFSVATYAQAKGKQQRDLLLSTISGYSPSMQKGTTISPTIHNPFLTRDVSMACNEARILYLHTLARMQQNGEQPVDWLERLRQQSQRNLDNYWDVAQRLALTDHIQGASAQLAFIVKEWGLYRALTDLIGADASCSYLDPADPHTYNGIQRALEHQVAYLATELFTAWLHGNQQRNADQLRQQQIRQRQTDWHDAAIPMLQAQWNAWH